MCSMCVCVSHLQNRLFRAAEGQYMFRSWASRWSTTERIYQHLLARICSIILHSIHLLLELWWENGSTQWESSPCRLVLYSVLSHVLAKCIDWLTVSTCRSTVPSPKNSGFRASTRIRSKYDCHGRCGGLCYSRTHTVNSAVNEWIFQSSFEQHCIIYNILRQLNCKKPYIGYISLKWSVKIVLCKKRVEQKR